VRCVVARTDWLRPESETSAALTKNYEAIAAGARGALSARWGRPDVAVVDQHPVDAILGEAQRFKATVIVLGWRGHGTFRRLLAGSVSRAVASRAECPVLVVRRAATAVRCFVVGFDGCENARRAVDFLSSLEPRRASQIVLINVVEPISAPASTSLLPSSARGHIQREVRALNAERIREAQATLDTAIAGAKRRGWRAKGEVRIGAPLERILSAVEDHSADMLVLGARAISGIERALLGSVANGALNRSRVPVLLVR
jgi:nucleotide-binding universal stress UspA family protein